MKHTLSLALSTCKTVDDLCVDGRFFLGSVSKYCSNHASCPVVIVKGEDGVLQGMSFFANYDATICYALRMIKALTLRLYLLVAA